MTEGDLSPRQRRPRVLTVAVTIVVVQLLAFALLKAGYGVRRSLGVAIGAGAVFLASPLLWRMCRAVAGRLHRGTLAVTRRVLDRRTYRFGLRTLLLLVLVAAGIAGWYFHEQRVINAERLRIDGKWMSLNRDGILHRLPDGTPMMHEFNSENYAVDPRPEPKHIDYHMPSGTSHGIYRWEGEELVVVMVSPGVERPESFDLQAKDIRLKPSVNVAEVSTSTIRFRRVRE
jgi:uncharacterized protein (TIGR03067 family)